MTDIYASKEESNALIQPDTRTPEQKKADELADKNWMNEQGVEPQRTWVGLTDEDCTRIYNEANGITTKNPPITTERIFKAMQAAHGIKE